MTKEMLKQYRFCKKRIIEINEEIDKLKRENTVQDTVQGSQRDFPYIMRARTISGCPNIYDNSSNINRLYAERDRCKKIVREISVFIHSIEDSIVRRALIMRYIEGDSHPKWDKIAIKIGGGNTADSIRKAVSRFIAKK